MAPSICSPGSQNIDGLYRAGWISEEENQYLQCLLTTSTHVPESERVVIMGIIQYYINTRDVNSPGYQWIQENQPMLDLYLEHGELKWPEEIKQHVLSEYYDAYVKDAAPPLLTAGAASVLEVEILDWGKCQALYDRISVRNRYKYMHIIWYGKPMQLNGSSPQEQELYRRLCNNSNYSIPWTQEKVDQLWESCEQIYDEYGIAIDPRFLLAIIIQEGTGSFNTSSENLAADGGHGIEENYLLDLMRVNALLFGKTLGYIYYNEQFREAANNNSDKLENSTGNIFTYYNWQTPIIDLESGCVKTGVYAGDYSWGTNAESIYEQLTYEGAGKDYNRYILNLDPSVVQDIAEGIAFPNFTFSAVENGLDYKGEPCEGAYTVIAE